MGTILLKVLTVFELMSYELLDTSHLPYLAAFSSLLYGYGW
jgi:hypothetical protein